VVRMSDRDPEFLRYLDGMGIRPGVRVQLLTREPFEGPLTLLVDGSTRTMGTSTATRVFIRVEP
jgi:DtxR family transcriptional regulator, Mn-dependent transcriptional regulator